MKLSLLTRSLPEFLFGATDHLDDLDEQARRRVRAAQISAVVQLVPLTMTINILNACVVVYVFWDTGSNTFLTVWAGLIAAVALAAFVSWRRTRRNPPKGASQRGINRTILHAAILGIVWGAAPFVLFPNSDTMHQLFLAATMAGMVSGGAFCLSTVPAAGLAYTWTIVFTSVSALISASYIVFDYTAALAIIYAVFMSRNLVAHGRLFFERLRYELKIESQRELIGLLLNDFQEHASDWLWETDVSGALTRVSDRFAEAAGKTQSELHGALLSDVIDGQREYRSPELTDVLKRMTMRTAFRDVTLPVRVGTERRFWLLSAKPIFDNVGIFTGYHGVGADVTEKRLANERIVRLARYDVVTELPNRTSFQEEIDKLLSEARSSGQPAALLCLDLDQFKSVNDTLGHPVGDALLKLVGQRIRSCVRSRDIVARLGGDEFAILQLSPDLPTGPMMLARLIVDAFKEPFKLEHGDIVIGTSIGIAIAPADGWAADSLMKKADLALYSAKADGAGTFRFFEPKMEAWAHRRRTLEIGLRSALENGEIHLAFQPLVEMQSWRIAGCEALVRWTSPEWGVVSPAEFIPVAEATGLIEPIGEWVLREAVKTARHWPDDTIVAVNLSPVQFRNQKLLTTVVSALADSGLPPHRLELEVTESVFLDRDDHVQAMLKNLRTLGVRTALDDFGTGYSSLSYLRRFPFDKIKIDKSFIDDVAAHDESLAIIRAIVALANALGMSTTAEGVESADQVARLRDAGCTQIQGYVFSPPRPAHDIVAMFESRLEGHEDGSVVAHARAADPRSIAAKRRVNG
jgi:diguanylate cyclase (GGDEF)-like protein/PAS domain S-box-containing protein/LPXTG-motif cell wall-anchored protein